MMRGLVSIQFQRPTPPRTRLLAATEGVGTIEFAVVASMLATLAIGMLDFGVGLWQQMEVGNAARAGAEYAALYGWNSSAIQTAITSATGLDSITASPSPTQSCGCPDVTTGVTAASCGSTCSSGLTAGTYVTVSAQASYSTILPYPGISSPLTLTASAIARIN
jgi:Flp pilus assembly protein TadG